MISPTATPATFGKSISVQGMWNSSVCGRTRDRSKGRVAAVPVGRSGNRGERPLFLTSPVRVVARINRQAPYLAPDAAMQNMMSSTYRLAHQLCEHLLTTLDCEPRRQRKTLALLHSVVGSICDRPQRLSGTEYEIALLVRSTVHWLADRPLDRRTVEQLRDLTIRYLGNERLTSGHLTAAYALVADMKDAPAYPVADLLASTPSQN